MKKHLLIISILLCAAHSFAVILEGSVTLNDRGTFLLTNAEGEAFAILSPANKLRLSDKLTPFLGKYVRVLSKSSMELNYEHLKYRLTGKLTIKEIPQGGE